MYTCVDDDDDDGRDMRGRERTCSYVVMASNDVFVHASRPALFHIIIII